MPTRVGHSDGTRSQTCRGPAIELGVRTFHLCIRSERLTSECNQPNSRSRPTPAFFIGVLPVKRQIFNFPVIPGKSRRAACVLVVCLLRGD